MIATIPRDHAKMENVNVNQAGNCKTAMVFYFFAIWAIQKLRRQDGWVGSWLNVYVCSSH